MTVKRNVKEGVTASRDNADRYVGRMNDALLTQLAKIRELLVAAETSDCRNRFEIAVLCKQVRDGDGAEKTYGKAAVNNLAHALGKKKTWVYERAQVAGTWDTEQFANSAARTDAFGKPLTWSHFVELSRVKDDSEREQRLEESLRKGWTVRELHKACSSRKNGEQANAGEGCAGEPEMPRDLRHAMRNYTAQIAPLSNLRGWGSRLRERIESSAPEHCTEDLLSQLKETRESLEREYRENITLLEACIGKVEQVCRQGESDLKIESFREDERKKPTRVVEEEPVGV